MKVKSAPRPQRVSWRIRMLARPRNLNLTTIVLPAFTPRGIRESALHGECSDRIADMSFPYIWRLFKLKKEYKHRFDEKRLEYVDTLIESGNTTMYTKLANATVDLKKSDSKKSKAWSDTDWKKHMDYISPLAEPKPVFAPRKMKKKKWKPLPLLLPRAKVLAKMPEFKTYRRLSQETWYRDPVKVSPAAQKYVISERMKILAKPKELPPPE